MVLNYLYVESTNALCHTVDLNEAEQHMKENEKTEVQSKAITRNDILLF